MHTCTPTWFIQVGKRPPVQGVVTLTQVALGGDDLLRAFTPLMKPISHCEFSEERMHSNHRNTFCKN